MTVPVIPTTYTALVFGLLFFLLVHREVLGALGWKGPRGWRIISTSLIGLLLMLYGVILLSRFLSLLTLDPGAINSATTGEENSEEGSEKRADRYESREVFVDTSTDVTMTGVTLPELKMLDAIAHAGEDSRSIFGTLRILMVTARYFPYIGGTEIHTYEVARRMAAAGHEVTVLTTDVSRRLPTDEESEGVRVLRVPAWPAQSDYYFAPEIHKTIMRGHWDLIHCQGYHTFVAPFAMMAAYQSGTPYVVTFHSGGHPSRLRNALRGMQRWMLSPLLAHAQRLIGVSAFETEFFSQRLHQPSDRFATISNGSYLPKAGSQRSDQEGTLIVSVGRLERYKGHHRTILALPEVVSEYPDVQLRIIGAGPYESDLWRLAKQCGVAKRVNIGPVAMNERSYMASILSEAKLAILLSDYESQGIAILEALSLGIPALVTHTSGLADLAKGGLVRSVPLNSSSMAIAEAILGQLHSPLIVPEVQLPSWDHCAAKLLNLYYEIHEQSCPNLKGETMSYAWRPSNN